MNYAKVFLSLFPDKSVCRVIAQLDREWRGLNHHKRVVVETIRDARGNEAEVTILRYDRIDQLRLNLSVNSQTGRKRNYVERTIAR